MKRIMVTVYDSTGAPAESVVVRRGEKPRVIRIYSPYLTSAGQAIEFSVSADLYDEVSVGWSLVDARHLGVVPTNSWAYPWRGIPTERTLRHILTEAANHSKDHPGHGYNCVCMDELIREVRAHVMASIPDGGPERWVSSLEWEKDFDRRCRVKHVLRAAINNF